MAKEIFLPLLDRFEVYLSFLGLFFLIGLPISFLLRRSVKLSWLIAPTIGYTIISFVLNACYVQNVSVATFARWSEYLYWLGSLIALYWLFILQRERKKSFSWQVIQILLMYSLVSLIVLLPEITGGFNFSAFQNNPTDVSGYLDSAVTYRMVPFDILTKSTKIQWLNNPLLPIGLSNLMARPAVHLLYAFSTEALNIPMLDNYYTFLILLLSQVSLISAFIVINSFAKQRQFLAIIATSAFLVGFYGQYIIDLNSWSQIAFSAPGLLMVFFWVKLLIKKKFSNLEWKKFYFVTVLLGCGLLFLYPEGYSYLMLAIVGSFILSFYSRIINRKGVLLLFFFLLANYCGGLLWKAGVLDFGIGVVTGRHGKPDWWISTASYLLGQDAIHGFATPGQTSFSIQRIIDLFSGFSGLYGSTPQATDHWLLASVKRILNAFIILAIFRGLWLWIKFRSKQPLKQQFILDMLLRIWLILVLGALLLVFMNNLWAASKAWSYMMPVTSVVIILALVNRNKFLRLALVFWLSCQIVFSIKRIYAARQPHGIHYSMPYFKLKGWKEGFKYSLSSLKKIRKEDTVKLDLPNYRDIWLDNFALIYLIEHRIRYFSSRDIYEYFWRGDNFGKQVPLENFTVRLFSEDGELKFKRVSSVK